MENLEYLSEIQNRLRKTRGAIRERIDNVDELIQLLDDLPYEYKDFFEDSIVVLLYRLQRHYDVWQKVLTEHRQRKTQPPLRRIK
ncbi:hypothetical protein M5X00_32490 [Paenibacillus alvei]|uniref:hypothetical protein n=1 Tax=Paenibacillus alvei TaxID=44250 RepID=UPI000289FC51|nr:hypothetical protein [Paenibacillus alvei]EJW13835.1 hypothetical protein PAV_109p00650 [Paenibacillus alvei DSM 29]MCY9540558.1 hypothetical protein [Paenibacillus alvei]MCY9708237.1 hypothetical protein [Paenibacillus alvei]MCY9758939.1 hypothetical protein [Paenibacillus alvei]MEC0080362.1 hypothetical protein [Paenibacillus alvei]